MTFKPMDTKVSATQSKPVAAERMTNMTTQTNVASLKPTSIRFTQTEMALLQQWVGALQDKTNKKITAAKLFRGLVHMQDGINQAKLIDSIQKNT